LEENTTSVEINTDIKGKKLWPYGEANKLLKRYDYSPDHIYTFETGFGPSGFPHIGTFGEVVRTEFIINALREAGFKTKLIVFSDDLDGLRKVPEDMPDWLGEHLGKPVSSIPDPFGERASFSDHMNEKLRQMLDWMEMDYEFRSSKECYENGDFDEAIRILLRNYNTLEKIIAPTLSKETLQDWYPFFPICEKCGSVLTTMVKNVNAEGDTVEYSCTKTHGTLHGCGFEGSQTALEGHGKMTWRVDWPMRWYALGIDYELYGKDLIESFKIGRRIMNQIFRTKDPENMFYEMFLDEGGAKISKSKGKGLTVEEWLKYGTTESLYLLMYRRPKKAKELSFNIIPSYVDDVISLSSGYHSKADLKEHEFKFDFISAKKHDIAFSDEDIFLLGQFVGLLYTELSAEEIHNAVYTIARQNGRNPRDFFRIIYLVFIGQDRGPRIGSFVKMIGQEKSVEIITGAIRVFFDEKAGA